MWIQIFILLRGSVRCHQLSVPPIISSSAFAKAEQRSKIHPFFFFFFCSSHPVVDSFIDSCLPVEISAVLMLLCICCCHAHSSSSVCADSQALLVVSAESSAATVHSAWTPWWDYSHCCCCWGQMPLDHNQDVTLKTWLSQDLIST